MMTGTILLSTAYLPPVEYLSLMTGAGKVIIENEENYVKQTWRNRCRILSSNGPLTMSVPVLKGVHPKIPVREVRIDYTKRWQQVHLGAITSSYSSAPWFQFYFGKIEEIILSSPELLIDLNNRLLRAVLNFTGIKPELGYTDSFEQPAGAGHDYRYSLSPGKKYLHQAKEYIQVFSYKSDFIPGLSIIDLLFNLGPDSLNYLKGMKASDQQI